jgi:hypothetical protein
MAVRDKERQPVFTRGVLRHPRSKCAPPAAEHIHLGHHPTESSMKDIGHMFSPVATVLLVAISAASPAHVDHENGDRVWAQNDAGTLIWQVENGCAAGNRPPPGANCFP